jgi:dTMP kinase
VSEAAPRGKFITFEGGEGSGKSTQARLLADALRASGREVVLTREPGGSEGAESIRRLIVEGDAGRWDPITETLLFAAARRDHVERLIRPSLDMGIWIVCDRFVDSTVAYQGYGGGVDLDFIDGLTEAAVGDLRPDLTVIFDLPAERGLARADRRGSGEDRFERMATDFHRRLREGFLTIAQKEPDRCVVISAHGEIPDIQAMIRAAVADRLGVALP